MKCMQLSQGHKVVGVDSQENDQVLFMVIFVGAYFLP